MDWEKFLAALWEAAASLGLVDHWQFWAAAFGLAVLLALGRVLPTRSAPEWDPEKGTGNLSPPMKAPAKPDGTMGEIPLDQERWVDGEPPK